MNFHVIGHRNIISSLDVIIDSYVRGLLADPTYMIRAIPSNASDNVYCTLLAQSAVHGAMAGFTGFTVGLVNTRHTYIPFNVSLSDLSLHIHHFYTLVCSFL